MYKPKLLTMLPTYQLPRTYELSRGTTGTTEPPGFPSHYECIIVADKPTIWRSPGLVSHVIEHAGQLFVTRATDGDMDNHHKLLVQLWEPLAATDPLIMNWFLQNYRYYVLVHKCEGGLSMVEDNTRRWYPEFVYTDADILRAAKMLTYVTATGEATYSAN